MRVLLTNDDGVQAPGLRAIREHLRHKASVVTIAPTRNCSGFSRACTFGRPVTVTRLEAGNDAVYSCDGTPTDCVRVGLLAGLASDVDLVVSGINHGANVADDIIYSGTVGAGLEAGILGTSAVCVSQQTPTGSLAVNYREDLVTRGQAYDFSISAPFAADLAISMVAAQPEQVTVLNVNIPTRMTDRTCRLATPGQRAYPRRRQAASPDGDILSVYLFGAAGEEIPETHSNGATDIAALRAGHVSVTLLSVSHHGQSFSDQDRSYLRRLSDQMMETRQSAAWADLPSART